MDFWKKLVSVLLVLIVLLCYNAVVSARLYGEQIDRLTVRAEGLQAQVDYDSELLSSLSETQTPEDKTENLYKNGEFEGSAKGYGGEIRVRVKISDDRIESIRIVSAEGEDSAYLGSAETLIAQIIEKQTPEVDAVTGATFSSTGIKNAVASALKEAVNE